MNSQLHQPLVSVVICAAESDRHLPQAIDSVMAQTFASWELLVIADGPAAPGLELSKAYGDRHSPSQLRYIRQRQQGRAAAWNHGMQLARGDAIAFLDTDDWLTPTKLERQWAMLQAHPEIGVVHSGWQQVKGNSETLVPVMPWHYCPHLDLQGWLQWPPLRLSAMLLRRKWLFQADGFNPQVRGAEAIDLILRLAVLGCPMAWLRERVVYTGSPDAEVMENSRERGRSLTAIINQILARSDLPSEVVHHRDQIRFHTWTWIAWDLYRTGHTTAMVDYLKQAWHHSPHPPVDTIIAWVEGFAEFSRRWGNSLETHQLCHSPEWQELMRWCLDSPVCLPH